MNPTIGSRVEVLVRQAADMFIRPVIEDQRTARAVPLKGGDITTPVDVAVEAFLTRELPALSAARVVGEEACHADSEVLTGLSSDRVWLIDPVDGTRNLIRGRGPVAVMVALREGDSTVGGWVFDVAADRMWATTTRRRLSHVSADLSARLRTRNALRGVDYQRRSLAGVDPKTDVRWCRPAGCAGRDYGRLLDGEVDFIHFPRTAPWDHAAGAALVECGGGVALRVDGERFSAGSYRSDAPGLLVARSREVWDRAIEAL